jgi:glycosyltransferase involved in cell wall biosynthesis
MRILYHFRTQGTGAEGVHIAGVAEAFEQLGHEVIFSNPSGVDPRTTAGANPFRAGKRTSWMAWLAAHAPRLVFELLEIAYNFICYLRLRRLLARESCQLIYERHAFFLCATAFLAQQRRIPLVVEVNELAGDERIRAKPWLLPLALCADRITFHRAWRVVVVSPHLRRRIEEMGVSPEKILVLPNAVCEGTLSAPPGGAIVRERLGCGQQLVIGFVGWFVAWHRLDIFLEEVAKLASDQVKLRVVLVGEGPLAGPLVEKTKVLGIATWVTFAGSVPHAEVGNYIDAMDICVVPHSNAYRSPIKIFEYMARGRAVVAPRTEPIAMVIHHGKNGLLFDPESAGDLGKQLRTLIIDSDLRERLGAHARSDVATHHTWQKNAHAVLRDAPVK